MKEDGLTEDNFTIDELIKNQAILSPNKGTRLGSPVERDREKVIKLLRTKGEEGARLIKFCKEKEKFKTIKHNTKLVDILCKTVADALSVNNNATKKESDKE